MRRYMRTIFFVAFAVLAAGCKEQPEPLLQGDKPDPQLRTEVPANDLFIVIKVVPYGHKNMLVLAVAEDGAHNRSTFIAPASMELKRGDVIKTNRLCYRASESAGKSLMAKDACTDIVIPYQPPTAESPPK